MDRGTIVLTKIFLTTNPFGILLHILTSVYLELRGDIKLKRFLSSQDLEFEIIIPYINLVVIAI